MKSTESLRLSVIIPVYNAEAYLRRCLDSVLAQGQEDMEIICVDDGSTDGSAALLQQLAAQEPRLRVILQENRSAGAARNRGLAEAAGEYVHFLDADDWLEDGLYDHCLSLLEEKQADVCFFQYYTYDNTTGSSRRVRCLQDEDGRVLTFRDRPAFFVYNLVAPWNKVYRRSWVEAHALRFDEIVCGNDRGFYYRMLAAGGRFVLSAFCGVYYRCQNEASLTGSSRYRHLDSIFHAWDTSAKALEGESDAVRAMLLDCVVCDLTALLQRTPEDKRPETAGRLAARFAASDLTVIRQLPFPCRWQEDDPLSPRPLKLWDRLRIFLGIWGLRGLAVKLRTR